MFDEQIDEIFEDLADDLTELRVVLEPLETLVPDGFFQLCDDRGRICSLPEKFDIEPEVRSRLLADALREHTLISFEQDGQRLYGYRLPGGEATLLFQLPQVRDNLLADSFIRDGFVNTIQLALLSRINQETVIENRQLQRHIKGLGQQHQKLIDENYEQYKRIQEKEKEYARELESEITRQTMELRQANVRLEEASRMKGEFLANMSHELRTPMNAIIGFSGLLAESRLDEEQADFVETIRKSSSSLLVLINDILDLAKIEAGKLDLEEISFELHGLLKSVTDMFRSQALDKNNKVTFAQDKKLPARFMGDENRLRQVLINLTGNAMKFTQDGTVEVLADLVKQEGDGIAIRFAVRDSGIGIPPERQAAIFEKFTQADGSTTRKYGGTGLGLSISCQLVELMQGEVQIESAVGKGSTFFFVISLPEAIEKPKIVVKPEIASAESTDEVKRKLRVLVVEDNPVNQKLATLLIKKQGCEVDVAGDGLQALDKLKEFKFDLILMDVQMPKMDGHEATRKIREIEATSARIEYVGLAGIDPVEIVGLTAHARKEDEQKCYDSGMNGFLTKPIVRDKLNEILQKRSR